MIDTRKIHITVFRIIFILPVVIFSLAVSWSVYKVNAQSQYLPWSVNRISNPYEGSENPTIVSDNLGGIHVFWSGHENDTQPFTLFYAYYNGKIWQRNDIFVDGVYYPSAAVDDKGVIHLVFIRYGVVQYTSAPVENALNINQWMHPVDLSSPTSAAPIIQFHKGILHLFFVIRDDNINGTTLSDTYIYYLQSIDYGRHWSNLMIFECPRDDTIMDKPRMNFGMDDTLHLVWSLIPQPEFYGGAGVYYTRSIDDGQSWSTSFRLDEPLISTPGLGAWYASIATDRENKIHVVWDAHSQGGRRYHQMSSDGGVSWTKPEPILDTLVSQTGTNPMIMDNIGNLYLFSAGTFDWNYRQRIYLSTWDGISWSKPQLVDSTTEEPHWIQTTISLGNQIYLVWEARAQVPRSIWYASTQINSQYNPPQEYLFITPSTPTPLVTNHFLGNPSSTSTQKPKYISTTSEQMTRFDSPLSIFYMPIALTIIVIGIGLVIRNFWTRYR